MSILGGRTAIHIAISYRLFPEFAHGELPAADPNSSMQDAERFKLLGHYETPRFEYGDIVFCKRVGEVQIVGLRKVGG